MNASARRIAVELFVALGALVGGASLLADAKGFGMDTAWLEGTPFPDYTVPGVALLLIAAAMLVAAALAVAGSPLAGPAARLGGGAVLAFLAVELLTVGYLGPWQLGFGAAVGAGSAWLIGQPAGR